MRRRVELTARVLLALSLAAVVRAQPTERFDAAIPGGITVTGNTLGLSKATQANGPGDRDGIGTFVTVDLGSVDDVPPNSSNPWFPGTTNDWRESSSAARLRLPVGATVLYAELVWSGSYRYVEDVSAFLDAPVLLMAESGLSTMVMPDSATARTLDAMLPSGVAANYYVRSANVTPFVMREGPGFYTVSGVPATQSEVVDTLQAAGWALLVAYADPAGASKTLKIAVDGRLVDEASSAVAVFSGLDVPSTGPVEGRLFVAGLEGDASASGDGVAISAEGGAFVPLSGPNNPVDNFFASQINDESGTLDAEGTFGNLNHDAITGSQIEGGRQGWDVTGVTLSQQAGQVENDQTTATVRASTTGDAFVLAALALEISSNPVDPVCGNGIVEAGEACDDGNDVAGDGCEPDCTFSPPPAICGDGIIGLGEECDAGAENGFPACVCTLECELPSPDSACGRINQCEAELDECLSDPAFPDADGDGETDATDYCPGTPPDTDVDQGGCSLAEYCNGFAGATPRDRLACRLADWRNDEILLPRDCRPTLDGCVPEDATLRK